MKIPQRKFAQLIVTVMVVTLIAACGGGDSGNDTATGSAAPAKNQTNPMSRENLREGGTFTWPLDQMPNNFNYLHLDGALHQNYYVTAALMPSPYTTDADGTPVWNRDVFAFEPVVTSGQKQVVTFQINPKAVWYDGTPITWEDFHWQWKVNNGADARYQISAANGYEDIESVEKGKDDREVIITFKSHYADWQGIFYLLYPASTNKDPKVFNEGWKDSPLTTAGPFKVASIDKTSLTITLVRNEKWWGDRAIMDTIVFRVIVPDAQVQAVANAEVDGADIGADANKYSMATQVADAEIRKSDGPNFRHITVNGQRGDLKDVRVRQALAMGIDRSTVARAMLGPLGVEPKVLDNHLFTASHAGYRNNSGDVGVFNQAKAAALLDSAGWKLDGDVRKKNNKPLEIDFVIPVGAAAAIQESQLVQNVLGQIGVTVKIRPVPGPDFFAKYVTPGQFDFTVFSWMGTAYPISGTKSIYGLPKKRPDGTLDIMQNYPRIGSASIDSLFNAANAELDRAKAIELANQVDALISEEVHTILLYQRPVLILTRKNLANFGAFGFAIPWRYQDIGWMK